MGIVHDSAIRDRSLRHRVVAVHSDCAPGIEAARKVVFPKSQTAKDQFHFAQHTGLKTTASGTLAKKMKHRRPAGQTGHYELTNLGWTVAALNALRRIPTLDCAPMLHEGSGPEQSRPAEVYHSRDNAGNEKGLHRGRVHDNVVLPEL
eukprot:3485637-Pyramimonas_sp.AAC.1